MLSPAHRHTEKTWPQTMPQCDLSYSTGVNQVAVDVQDRRAELSALGRGGRVMKDGRLPWSGEKRRGNWAQGNGRFP